MDVDFPSGLPPDDVPHTPHTAPGGQTKSAVQTRCDCKGCGTNWQLAGCSAKLRVTVSLYDDVTDPVEAEFYRSSEAQHVADFRAGTEKIQKSGADAESLLVGRMFTTKYDCELTSLTSVAAAVEAAVEAAAHKVSQDSEDRYDHGAHTWMVAPLRNPNPPNSLSLCNAPLNSRIGGQQAHWE